MATNPRNSEPLVFPVGHYLGPFYPGENAPLKHHIVRVGWGTPKLPDDDHMSLWALSHGMSSRIGTIPWTRRAVEDAAHEAGMNDPAPIFDTLLKLGVVVELGDPMEFAKRYRMQALMVGLGNTPDDPLHCGIGLPGVAPAVVVPLETYQLWEWGHLGNSLWHSCELLADVARETLPAFPEEADPAYVLDRAIGGLRTLIAHNVAYLDVARTPRAA